MDREVAIELLKQEKRSHAKVVNICDLIGIDKEHTDEGRATIEALDLAIEALSEPQIEKHQLSGETSTNTPTCNHTCNKKQVTSKLKNPDDSLLTEESEACKEQKSKLDCISRQQAIEAIEKGIERIREIPCVFTEGDFYYHNALKLAQEIIELQPPVTPTERTGEWKIWNEPGNEFVFCPKCKHEYDQIDLYIGGSEYPNYCPNCGAKMTKGGDE